MPPEARYAVSLLAAGWALHYAFYFGFLGWDESERASILQLAVGIGICYAVAAGRKWARMLCVFFNVGVFALYAVYSLVFASSGNAGLFAVTAAVSALFAASTFFLLKKSTAGYFNRPPSPESPG